MQELHGQGLCNGHSAGKGPEAHLGQLRIPRLAPQIFGRFRLLPYAGWKDKPRP